MVWACFEVRLTIHAPKLNSGAKRKASWSARFAAQFDLGFMYRNGEGVPQDNGEALRWYRLALFLSRCGHRIFPCPRSYFLTWCTTSVRPQTFFRIFLS